MRALPDAAVTLLRAAEPGLHPAALWMLGGLYGAAARRRALAQAAVLRAGIAGALLLSAVVFVAFVLPLVDMMSGRMSWEVPSFWERQAEICRALLPVLAVALLAVWLLAGVRAYVRARRAAACRALAQALRGGLPPVESLLAIAEESGWRYRRWARATAGKPLERPRAYERAAESLGQLSRLPRAVGVACLGAATASWIDGVPRILTPSGSEGLMGQRGSAILIVFWLVSAAGAAGLAFLLRRPPLPLLRLREEGEEAP